MDIMKLVKFLFGYILIATILSKICFQHISFNSLVQILQASFWVASYALAFSFKYFKYFFESHKLFNNF